MVAPRDDRRSTTAVQWRAGLGVATRTASPDGCWQRDGLPARQPDGGVATLSAMPHSKETSDVGT